MKKILYIRHIYNISLRHTHSKITYSIVFRYFQHGSYPLVTPYNETYPDYFYLNRTDAYHVALKKDADFVTFELMAPRPGTWYFASFLPKATSDKIEQKVRTSLVLIVLMTQSHLPR